MAKKTNAQIKQEVNEALLSDLLSLYSYSEEQMLKKVAKRVAKGATDTGWNEMKLGDTTAMRQEIEQLLKSPGSKAKSIMGKEILKAYKEGVNATESQKGKPLTAMSELNIPLSVQNLLLANYDLIDNANSKILRQADDAYREMMAQSAATVLTGVDTRLTASQKMMDRLAAKGITTFTDKAGRTWDMGSYTEMAIRTATAHAALQGQIDTQQSFGMDLMKVSSIGTTCPICARWQGVVLSISGKSGGYHTVDQAKAAGLFHPNCKHTLLMFDPELDGEGQKELNDDNYVANHSKQYDLIQQQRANERMIRYWKRRNAAAITPKAKFKTSQKVKTWQYKNLLHCEKHGLRRNYAREGVRSAKPITDSDILIGGRLPEYVQMYQDVVGEDPRKAYNVAKKFLSDDAKGSDGFVKWVRDEIKSLDNIDIERAQMRDAKNKEVTPTSLYKKYIGDNPMQDYAAVAPYEKGSKDFKSGYAKWLKEQVEGIGTIYKVKPTTPEVIQIPPEDRGLSATNLYKKYYGKAPTEAYKEAGGEEGTGMKYGKWIESQKKDMIANGVKKTPGGTPAPAPAPAPTPKKATPPKPKFDNVAVQKTQKTAEKAEKVIKDAKKAGVFSKGKDSIANIEDEKKRKKAVLKEADEIFNEISKDPDYAIETLEDFGIDAKDVIDPKGPPGSYSKEKLANTLAKVYDIKEAEFPGTTKWKEKAEKTLRKKSTARGKNTFEEKDYSEIIKVLTENYSPSYQVVFNKTLEDMKGFDLIRGDENNAYYNPGGKFINLDVAKARRDGENGGAKSRYQTLFHEMGHAIDNKFGISMHKDLKQSLQKDRKRISEAGSEAIPKKGAAREKMKASEIDYILNLDSSSGKLTAGVQDTLGGLGFERSYYLKWGHSESYWDRRDRLYEASSENFAHVSERFASEHNIKGKTYNDAMEHFFPNYIKAAEDHIKKWAERSI